MIQHLTRYGIFGSCTDCDLAISDQHLLTKYIDQEGIPLVRCWENEVGQVEFEIVKGSLESEYTAISHIWAGGLGNRKETAIYRCQLANLRTIIEHLPRSSWRDLEAVSHETVERLFDLFSFPRAVAGSDGPSLFWLDTLCIPMAKGLEKYRTKAIGSMAQIYAAADKVLVLDPDLQKVPSKDLVNQADLLGTHIGVSPWMSRSWPLQ